MKYTPRPVDFIPNGERLLTPRQLLALRYTAMGYTYVEAAQRMGTAVGTIKIQLAEARVRLDVSRTIDAFVALGWLRVPAE